MSPALSLAQLCAAGFRRFTYETGRPGGTRTPGPLERAGLLGAVCFIGSKIINDTFDAHGIVTHIVTVASLRRKPNSSFWIACFTDADGRQRQRSTQVTVRATAQRIADGFESVYRLRLTEEQVRRVMGEIFEDVHKTTLAQPSLADWSQTWLERKGPELSPKTAERYREVIDVVVELAPELGKTPIDRVATGPLLALRNDLLACRSPATVNQALKVLGGCLKAAFMDGLISENPVARVPRVRVPRAAGKRPFTVDQVRQLLAAADDEWRGMILAGLYSGGQRLGDIATMTAGQVDLAARAVYFTTDKTGRKMAVPLVESWRKDLAKRVRGLAPGASIFPRAAKQHRGAGGRATDISKGFRRLLHGIGLAPKIGVRPGSVIGRREAQPYSFHSFRHTATSMLKNAGVSDSVTRDIVGHDSVAVSEVYTHIDEAAKRRALEMLPRVG